jgi:hypothetical protein
MRKELVIILVLLFGGVIIAYNWGGASPLLSLRSARGTVSVETAPAPAAKLIGQAAERSNARRKADGGGSKAATDRGPAQTTAQTAAVPSPVETAAAKVCCARPDPPFPTPELMRTGATTAELRATFGVPSVDIAGTREGRVLERYYYVNRERSRLTIANIENGLLISAESLSSPYFHLPHPGETDSDAHSQP